MSKKNIMALILSLTFILILCCAGNINISSKGNLNAETITKYENSTGTEKRNLETKIIENIFNNLGRASDIPLASSSELTVTNGDVVGDNQQDLIFTVKIGPRNSVVVVYKKVGNEYEFAGLVDNFYEVQDIEVIKVDDNEKYLIMVRERVNQMLGAYEDSIFLRAYKWDEKDNKFKIVLSLQEKYKSMWNELWDNVKPKEESHWLAVNQDAKTTKSKDNYDTLYLKGIQEYKQSNKTNQIDTPNDSEFSTLSKRNLSQVYNWSNKWQHYILGEGTEIPTGQKVAILQDMEQDVFDLVEKDLRYRIKRPDGTIEFVDKNTIKRD